MQLDQICFLTGLMLVPVFFFFFRGVLFDPRRRLLFFAIALALAAGGLSQLNNAPPGKPNFYLFLLCPLYSCTLLQVMLYFFRSNFKRDPQMVMRGLTNDGLGWDRFFNCVFLILSIAAPVGVLGYFYP